MILPFAYTIIRSKRKSIQIRVNTQGQVEAVSYTHLDVYKRQVFGS